MLFLRKFFENDSNITLMKTTRTLLIALLLVIGGMAHAQTRSFNFSNNAENTGFAIENTTRQGLQIRHAIKQMDLVSVTDNGYSGEEIIAGMDIFLPADEGTPNLPATSRFVAIPNGASASVQMGYRSMTTIHNVDIMPAAPLKFDTDDTPNTYEKDLSIYNKDAFYPAQPVSISEPFSMRGVQTVAVTITPYQYNPVTKELRVYDDLQFSLNFNGGTGEFGEERLRSPYWDPILMQNLANYNQLPVVDYEARMQQWVQNRPDGCEYLIVIPNNEAFRPYANQLKEYRIKQGIITDVKSLSDMGCNSTNDMKTYFHNAYNTWTIAPVAVLLLGDHNTNMSAGIPAEYTYHSYSYGNCITDNGYADVTGDNLPEMAFSRLVAASAAEAQMMVSKQLEYEYTNPNTNASTYDQPITALGWQTERWFQICSEVVGGYWRNQGKHPVRINAIYQGNPGSQWSTATNTSTVVNYFGPNGRGYIPATPSELGGWTGGTAQQVVDAVNNGCMLLQHRDHGYYQGWGEPSFSNSNVSQMNNVGKLTFVNTINCQTGTFDYNTDCLIEAFMRRTYNGQNAGAVGCIGPTQTSYSFVNDAYAWGLYDQYDPGFMPEYGPYANYEGNWQPAFGNVAGKYFLAQSSWPYNTDSKAITYKMFTAHCDAFLRLYTQVPTSMNVSHPSQISSSTTSINVTAPAGAVIALTRDENILAVATATGNSQSISFPAQPSNSTITIVATKQDKLRYQGTITVISEPHLEVISLTLNDASGNGELEFGETATFSLTVKNTGNLSASAATATLTTTTPEYVTITNSTAEIPALNPNHSADLENVFGISIGSNVPNGTRLGFTITMIGGGYTWTHNFNYIANAPVFKIHDNFVIDDGGSRNNGNGRLDPGETAQVTFSVKNNGGANSLQTTATLTTMASQYISISNPTVSLPSIAAGQSVEVSYTVSVAANMPKGEIAALTLNVTSGSYSDTHTFEHRVGLDFEDFENSLETLGWVNDPDHPWTISSNEPYSGTYCLQSGNIANGESSTISMPFNVENATDEIRFLRKTNGTANSDYLKFYIDGEEVLSYTGALNWREAVAQVTQGEHTFSWTYTRGASGGTGDEHGWIDAVLFPVRHISFSCNAGNDQDICLEATAQLYAIATGYETIAWTTAGDGTFDDATIINPVYTPGQQDLEDKAVTLTITITNEEGETLTDDIVIRIHDAASIVMDEEASICYNATFTANAAISEAGQVSWNTNGDGSFDEPNSLEAIYTPGEQDIVNGNVTLTLNANSPYGCGDAEASIVLTIHPLLTTEFSMTACQSFNWNGTEYTESGDYEQTFENFFGCDSIVTCHLTISDKYLVDLNEIACDSFEWDGELFTQSGDYEKSYVSAIGCDSIVTLHLTVNQSSAFNFEAVACDMYEWNGIEYTETGEYQQTFVNAVGCDSIVNLSLVIESVSNMQAIEGDNDVDSYLTPSNAYTLPAYTSETVYEWSLEPAEAGEISTEDNVATIVWDETFKGEAILTVNVETGCGEGTTNLAITVKNSFDVNENIINARLYPNPTSGNITIEAAGMQHLTMVNALGQVVIDMDLDTDATSLNMAQYGKGMYVVRILTKDGCCTSRINVN